MKFNLKFFIDFLRYKKYQFLTKKKYNSVFPENSEYKIYIDQLKKNGYVVLKNFIKKENCKKIIEVIDKFIIENPKLIWNDENESDTRIYGAENISDEFFSLIRNLNDFTKKIGKIYLNQDIDLFMVMANKTKFKLNNLGSGGGWHKDSYSKQFKSILYLKDVDKKNGPFQLIKKSKNDLFIIRMFLKLKNKFPSTRFTENDVNVLLNKNNKEHIIEFLEKAGTLILIDTSHIHRGKPLEEGIRYALTNYFYPKSSFKNHENHFLPILKKIK